MEPTTRGRNESTALSGGSNVLCGLAQIAYSVGPRREVEGWSRNLVCAFLCLVWLPLADMLRQDYYDVIMGMAEEVELANRMIFAV